MNGSLGIIPGIENLKIFYAYPSAWLSLFSAWVHVFDSQYLLQIPSMLTTHLMLLPITLLIFDQSLEYSSKHKFLGYSTTIALIYLLANNYVLPSSNPDLSVILMTPVCLWIIYCTGIRPRILFILSLMFVLKLHGGLFSICIALLLLLKNEKYRKSVCYLIIFTTIVLIPSILESTFKSGYTLLPLPLPALNLPWANQHLQPKDIFESILEHSRLANDHPISDQSFLALRLWIKRENLLLPLLIANCLLLIGLRKKRFFGLKVGLVATLIGMIIAPTWRYTLGVLLLAPATFLSHPLLRLTPLYFLLAYFLSVGYRSHFSYSYLKYLVLPDTEHTKFKDEFIVQGHFQGQPLTVVLDDVNGKELGFCWSHSPLCTPYLRLGHWSLVDPQIGLNAGIKAVHELHQFEYLRPIFGSGDLSLLIETLSQKCISGYEMECALSLRYQAITKLLQHPAYPHQWPTSTDECLQYWQFSPKTVWRCLYNARILNLSEASFKLQDYSYILPIDELIAAPGCIQKPPDGLCSH